MQLRNDFDTTVKKAFNEIDPEWESYDGLVVCGTHTPHDMEKIIEDIRLARESGLPFLGICFGHQIAAIEYARNALYIEDAVSEEWGDGINIVEKRPEGLKVGLHDGETYWNNYEVVPEFIEIWEKPDNFITVQYHPEYQSSRDKPHPLLVKFLNICRKYTADTHRL